MKIKLKSIIALVLALTMAFSLAACGKGSDNGGSTGGNNGGSNGGASSTPTPEYVYSAQFKELETSTYSMNARFFTDDGFYATRYVKVGENIPEGAVVEYEGQYDVYETRLLFVGFDGTKQEMSAYEPLPTKENTEGYRDYYSSSELSGIAMGPDGTLIAVETVYTNWNESDESVSQDQEEYWNGYKYITEYYIRVLDENGAELSIAEIPINEGEYLNTYAIAVDRQGNLLLSNDTELRAIAADGSVAYTIPLDSYADSFVQMNDDSVAILTWGESGMVLSTVDEQSRSLGQEIPLPDNAYTVYPGGGDYDLYYISGINLFGYNIETQQSELLFNWINCDINPDNVSSLSFTEDGVATAIINTWDSNYEEVTIEMATISKVPYDSLPQKQTLTMAVLNLDWNMRNTIINFNRKSDDVRIEIVDYSQYNTEEDYEAGLTKLNTEIMAGNIPDILSLDQLPYTQLAAKGLLEDLYPYIDADSSFDRDDFFTNVLDALSVDGKLYQIAPSFSVLSVLGASSVVGSTPGWTYEQFNQALASMPEGCTPFDVYVTRDEILQQSLILDMSRFVDWSTGQCNFDSQEFIDLLNFAMLFPESFDWDNYDWSQEESTESRIAQGKQMLLACSIYSFNDVQYNDYYFGGDATYIGYPTAEGVGNMLNTSTGYAISASCSNKDAAWSFLRTLLEDDYQLGQYSLPIKISAYLQLLEEAMTPQYQTDGEGNYVLDENGDRIEISTGGMGSSDGTVYEFYAITQEQADKLWDVITTTTKLADYNSSVFDIVSEQAQAFFAGQKSAEEVARLVQNMANIYVNEQR